MNQVIMTINCLNKRLKYSIYINVFLSVVVRP